MSDDTEKVMRTFLTEISEEDISKRYLAENGLVAIQRELAEDLAKCDGGPGTHLMAYNAKRDCYVRKMKIVKDAPHV